MQERGPKTVLRPPFDPKELFRLSAQGIYLGTSSWKYRGWEGMIYEGGYSSEAQFQRASLREYTNLFPTVGVDFTYYTWPLAEMMAYLVESTPENFRLCPKVTKRITLSQFPDLPAYGKWAGQKNPDYLNADLFREQFLLPLERLRGRMGIVLFEFSGPAESELEAMARFFSSIPRDFTYAVEIRNPDLVNPNFYGLLKTLNVTPALSVWTKMPSIAEQWSHVQKGGGVAHGLPLVGLGVVREGRSYEEAVNLFQPYREVQEENLGARKDLAALINNAMSHERKAFILVNNRLEGSAPHTLGKIADWIRSVRKVDP